MEQAINASESDNLALQNLITKSWPAIWINVAIGTALFAIAFCRFFHGTYFVADDFVWMCFCKFYPNPFSVFWQDTLCQQFFRPMGELWYRAIFAFSGNEVWSYQAGFLLVHILNGYLVALLANRLTSRPVGPYVWLLFTLNGLFVTQISICYFFIFDTLGFSFYLIALISLNLAQARRPCAYGIISLLAALASYLTKEAYFTLPGACILVLGIDQGRGWSWTVFFRRWRWFILHIICWVVALSWRTCVIQGFGGYGLASIDNHSDLIKHLLERAGTWIHFACWSILPPLGPNSQHNYWILAGSALILVSLAGGLATDRRIRPWVAWSLCWAIVTWAPSFTMTTFAPVSWYAPAFGIAVLGSLALYEWKWGRLVSVFFGVYLSIHALAFYLAKEPSIQVLKLQQKTLEKVFPSGGSKQPPHSYYILLDLSPDLYADPVVKFHTPFGTPVADAFFVNPARSVVWVLTNSSEPQDLSPLVISPDFQRGFMDLGKYRVYPLSIADPSAEIGRVGTRRYRFFRWARTGLIEIFPKDAEKSSMRLSSRS